MNPFSRDALSNFNDPEYRRAFADEFRGLWIAGQIRALREQRDWTQEQLAAAAGMKQSRISTLESTGYSSWSVKTLKRLADAYDVDLVVEFRSFGKRLNDFGRFASRDLSEPPFDGDVLFQAAKSGLPEPIASVSSGELVPRVIREGSVPLTVTAKAL